MVEGAFLLKIGSFDGGGVFNVPMPGHRETQPYRTGLARRAVADGKHEIEFRRVRPRQFFPALRAQAFDRITVGCESFQRERVDRALWVASGGIGMEASASMLAQDAFGEDRARKALAPGLTPRVVLEKLATMQMIDVELPTTDDRVVVLSRYTERKRISCSCFDS